MKFANFAFNSYRVNILGVLVLAISVVSIAVIVDQSFYLTMLVYAAINAIAALGLCLLFGFAGQISLGQAAFFGVGAYVAANFVTRLDISPAIGVIGSTFVAALLGWGISRPVLRLSANYLAMGTLAFGGVSYTAFTALHFLTGGLDPGVVGVPSFSIVGFDAKTPASMLVVSGIALCLVLLLAINLLHSRIGRALRALRTSEVAAAGLGVDVIGLKSAMFTIAAGLAGMAGALFAFFQSSFNASAFGVGFSIELLVMVIIGSLSTPWGAVFGALVVTVLPNLLEGFDHYKTLAYGIVMTLVVIYMPMGFGSGVVEFAKAILAKVREK